MINGLTYKNKEFSYPIFDYLYPYLLRYLWRNDLILNSETRIIEIEKESIEELKVLLQILMIELLDEFYIAPEEADLIEYKGRYEKVMLNDTLYTLNITTNAKDRVVFQIFTLYQWLKEVSQVE